MSFTTNKPGNLVSLEEPPEGFVYRLSKVGEENGKKSLSEVLRKGLDVDMYFDAITNFSPLPGGTGDFDVNRKNSIELSKFDVAVRHTLLLVFESCDVEVVPAPIFDDE